MLFDILAMQVLSIAGFTGIAVPAATQPPAASSSATSAVSASLEPLRGQTMRVISFSEPQASALRVLPDPLRQPPVIAVPAPDAFSWGLVGLGMLASSRVWSAARRRIAATAR